MNNVRPKMVLLTCRQLQWLFYRVTPSFVEGNNSAGQKHDVQFVYFYKVKEENV